MGLFYDDRLALFLTAGDVHCGWSHIDWFCGGLTHEDTVECWKMGVNIIIYALTH